VNWTHNGPAVLASFLASLVEFVEALTIVLAVAITRGLRAAILGALAAAAALIILVFTFGPSLRLIDISKLQLSIGVLLLLFGMRWLRKAILRAAGILSLHDETKIFVGESEALRALARGSSNAVDILGFVTAFKAVMIEGIEVVFIVIAVGATANMLLPASLGALAAGLLVVLIGLVLHKPVARLPENELKFFVGVLLSAFGVFWIGEGLRFTWISGDWAIIGLAISFFLVALAAKQMAKSQRAIARRRGSEATPFANDAR
jgi:Ca2+/H+ antiporter, TMEM165/GDT1 family